MNFENTAVLAGQIVGDVTCTHEKLGEIFCEGFIEIGRTSEAVDTLPFVMSERILKSKEEIEELAGKNVTLYGEIRSRRELIDADKNLYKMFVYVFVHKLEYMETLMYKNDITVSGYIKAEEIQSRETPKGRTISDVYIAVPRSKNLKTANGMIKNDSVPCIVWGRNALYAERFKKGDAVRIKGRFQSRVYQKMQEDGLVNLTTYEVSGNEIEAV